MKNSIIFLLLSISSLYASQATSQELNGIYTEALLFVGIFGTMGIISYIYSNRHAKAYRASDTEKQRKVDEKEHEDRVALRVSALTLLLQDKKLTNEEFFILKSHYQLD